MLRDGLAETAEAEMVSLLRAFAENKLVMLKLLARVKGDGITRGSN